VEAAAPCRAGQGGCGAALPGQGMHGGCGLLLLPGNELTAEAAAYASDNCGLESEALQMLPSIGMLSF